MKNSFFKLDKVSNGNFCLSNENPDLMLSICAKLGKAANKEFIPFTDPDFHERYCVIVNADDINALLSDYHALVTKYNSATNELVGYDHIETT